MITVVEPVCVQQWIVQEATLSMSHTLVSQSGGGYTEPVTLVSQSGRTQLELTVARGILNSQQTSSINLYKEYKDLFKIFKNS